MAKLSTAVRKALPGKSFALPGRKYPIPDENHARNALARASANATPAQKAVIRAKVAAKFPSIKLAKPVKVATVPVKVVKVAMPKIPKIPRVAAAHPLGRVGK